MDSPVVFTNEVNSKRIDNLSIMLSDFGKCQTDSVNYVFKLESRVRELERRQEVLIDIVKRLSERLPNNEVLR